MTHRWYLCFSMHNNSIIKGDNYEHLHPPLLPVCLLNFCVIATSHSAWYNCFVLCLAGILLQNSYHPTLPPIIYQNHPTASIQLTLHPFTKPSSWMTLSSLLASPCLFHNQSEFLLAISQWYKAMNKSRDAISKRTDWIHYLRKNPELYLSCNESPF